MRSLRCKRNRAVGIWMVFIETMLFPVCARADFSNIATENLTQSRPADFPDELKFPQVRNGLNLAFTQDDMRDLLSRNGFDSCETSSPGPGMFSKNFGNFGSDCYKKFQDIHYRNFEVVYRTRKSDHLLPDYPWNGAKFSNISKEASTRFAGRSVSRIFSNSPFLKNLIEGKLAVDVSLYESSDQSFSRNYSTVPRPKYELAPENLLGYQDRTITGGLGITGSTAISGFVLQSPLRRARNREIVEVWPTAPEAVYRQPDFATRLGSRLGLSSAPFSHFSIRVEHTRAAAKENFLLRVSDTSELVYVLFNGVPSGKINQVEFGYKVPFKRHSLNVHYSAYGQQPVTTYTYFVDSNNRADVAYNFLDHSYSAGIKYLFQ